jgi:hypothetical protein
MSWFQYYYHFTVNAKRYLLNDHSILMQICCRFHHEQITCSIFALASHPLLWYIHAKRVCAYFYNVVLLTPLQCSYVWSSWMVLFSFSVPKFYGGSMWNTRCMTVLLTIMLSNVKLCVISLIPHHFRDFSKVIFFPPLMRAEQKQLSFWYWCIYPSVILRLKLQLLPRMKGF